MMQTRADLDDVQERAARLFLAAQEGRLSDAEAADLEAWLAERPAHREAYERVVDGWDAVGALAAAPELIVMRRKALANASRSRSNNRRRPGKLWSRGALAAAAVLAVAVMGYGYVTVIGPERTSSYQTAAGERRTITLADQSKVSMDEGTRLEVRYSGRSRAVRLVSGQAEFQVAHDTRRPFAVTAGERTVVATGTAFNVDLIASRLVVTLIEGRVVVADADAWKDGRVFSPQGARPIEMHPSDQLIVGRDRQSVVRSTDASAAVAWKLGKLVFDNEPLSQAVERMNRYASGRISLVDPALAATPVSGVFDAGDTGAFVEAVTAQFKIRSVPGPNGALLLYRPA